MSVRFFSIMVLFSLSLFLTACGGDDNGGNGNRRAGLIDTSGVRQFGVGSSHACAVLKTGKLACWGGGDYGKLGDGEAINRRTPVEVALGEGRTARLVYAGWNHSCAIHDDGSLACWGQNHAGQLGVGDQMFKLVATEVNLGTGRTAKAVSLGWSHTCALLDDHSVQCWGGNPYGQVGDGTRGTNRQTPVSVNLGDGVKARGIGVGERHSCALLSDGKVACWGANSVGQLGDGSNTPSNAPVTVGIETGRSAVELAVGDFHACAILDDGSLVCWGGNSSGDLGIGTNTVSENSPVAVDLGEGRKAFGISAGRGHTCALLDDDSVKCWGRNRFGQVGDETIINRNTPTAVALGTGRPVRVGAGGHSSCALFDDDSLACWGNNDLGQLGTGEETFVVTPEALDTGDDTIAAIDGGLQHGCALFTDSDSNVTLKCWGGNGSGQLGLNDQTNRFRPTEITSTNTPTSISVGSSHTCAIFTFNTTDTLTCWGENEDGQLGLGGTNDRTVPTTVDLGTGKSPKAVSAGLKNTCAILNDDKIKCWGEGSSGELGNSDNNDSNTPVSVTLGDNTAKKISVGASHTCAILNDYSVACWGNNIVGQLGVGDNTARNEPTGVNLGTSRTATGISTGNNHTCALLNDKSVVCWGHNDLGQLGDRSWNNQNSPVSVPLGSGRSATAIHAKGFYSCAILDDGSLLCWGRNNYGQLGDGTTTNRNTPVAVDLGEGRTATAVGGGPNHTCAILDDESVKCWGDNHYGQAGVPTSHRGDQAGEMGENLKFVKFEQEEEKSLPEITLGLGFAYSCAMRDGRIRCWGLTSTGRLGVGTVSTQSCTDDDDNKQNCLKSPTLVNLGEGRLALKMGIGLSHSCALLDDGSSKCWGQGDFGQLGNGATGDRNVPVAVNLADGERAKAIIADNVNTCAILNDGSLKCWGYNAHGAVGDGTTNNRNNPVAIDLGEGKSASAVDVGSGYVCAILNDGSLKCWGHNGTGELGVDDTTNRNTPTKVTFADGKSVLSISLGSGHSCAILNDGSLFCWGINNHGQLGVGTNSNEVCTLYGDEYDCIKGPTEVDLGADRTASGITLGANHTCALLDNGSVKCWGKNASGQLGDKSNIRSQHPRCRGVAAE